MDRMEISDGRCVRKFGFCLELRLFMDQFSRNYRHFEIGSTRRRWIHRTLVTGVAFENSVLPCIAVN
jgi:hypothetical protein